MASLSTNRSHSATVLTTRWLELIESDYIRTYIAEGGSAVKFVVTGNANTRRNLSRSLTALAYRNGFQPFLLDSRSTKLHFIQMLFHELARQLEWEELAAEYLASCFRQIGVQLPLTTRPVDLAQIDQTKGADRNTILERLQSILRADLIQDYAMSHEFRTAMLHLCLGQVSKGDREVSPFAPAVVRWLRGETQYLSEIKEAKLFQKVARNNARHLLTSLTHMLRKVGRRGTLVTLDISRYLTSNRLATRVDGNYYTPAAVVDLYELLRQLIDEQNAMEGLLIVVLATPNLLDDFYRSLDRYQALKMRVVEDVRVRSKQNLLAPMVHL